MIGLLEAATDCFGKSNNCFVPTEDIKGRFLDQD